MKPSRPTDAERFLAEHRPTSLVFHLDYVQIFGSRLAAALRPLLPSPKSTRDRQGLPGFRSEGIFVFPDAIMNSDFGIRLDRVYLRAVEASDPALLRKLHTAIHGRYSCINRAELVCEVAFETEEDAEQLRNLIRQYGHLRWARSLPFTIRTTQYIGTRKDQRQVTVYTGQSKVGTIGPCARIQLRLGGDALHSQDIHDLPDLAVLQEFGRIPDVLSRHYCFADPEWELALRRFRKILIGKTVTPGREHLADRYLQLLKRDIVAKTGNTRIGVRVLSDWFLRPDTPWPSRDVPLRVQRQFWRHAPSLVDMPDFSRDFGVLTTTRLLEEWRRDPQAARKLAEDHGFDPEPLFHHRPDYRYEAPFDLFRLLKKYANNPLTRGERYTKIDG